MANQSRLSLAWQIKGGPFSALALLFPPTDGTIIAGELFASNSALEVCMPSQRPGYQTFPPSCSSQEVACLHLSYRVHNHGCGSWPLDDAAHIEPTDLFRNSELSEPCDVDIIQLGVQKSCCNWLMDDAVPINLQICPSPL